MSIIPPNKIKQALKEDRPVIGTMVVESRQVAVMQFLANAGFDFAIIDNEHGPFTIETIAELSRAARHHGLTPVVRVPDIAYPLIAQPLDAGAQAIMIPRITEAGQVRQAIQMMKYPPLGSRGSALSRGYTGFRSGSVVEAMAQANEETMLIVQIETRQALENREEIIALPGVDAALIGPNDLAIALGVPGQLNHPDMQSAIQAMIATCQQHNVVPALHINDLELARYWAGQGMRLLSFKSEVGLMMQAGQEAALALRQAFG